VTAFFFAGGSALAIFSAHRRGRAVCVAIIGAACLAISKVKIASRNKPAVNIIIFRSVKVVMTRQRH
jgi:hypothetical protein